MRVEIVLFDGFDELDVFGPFEALNSAGADVELVRFGEPGRVVSQRGIVLEIPRSLARRDIDGVIVPGGGWLTRADCGAWAEVQRGDLGRALRQLKASVTWLASVCSGGMILGHAGLLEGRRATTNRACFDEIRPLVGELIDARVVDDGDVVTAGALSSGLDLGLHLARRWLGDEAADRASRSLEYPPARPQPSSVAS